MSTPSIPTRPSLPHPPDSDLAPAAVLGRWLQAIAQISAARAEQLARVAAAAPPDRWLTARHVADALGSRRATSTVKR